MNEVKSFVGGGLQDLSVSRLRTSVSWGVPVPDDPDAHDVRLVRCAFELHHCNRFWKRRARAGCRIREVLAWRCIWSVKTFLRFPCGLLARVSNGGWCEIAEGRHSAWNVG